MGMFSARSSLPYITSALFEVLIYHTLVYHILLEVFLGVTIIDSHLPEDRSRTFRTKEEPRE